MGRIIPNRLRSFRNGESANNSGTSTPRTANQREVSPGAAKMNSNGLMLNVVVMRVCLGARTSKTGKMLTLSFRGKTSHQKTRVAHQTQYAELFHILQ